jgi:hypothetical protein
MAHQADRRECPSGPRATDDGRKRALSLVQHLWLEYRDTANPKSVVRSDWERMFAARGLVHGNYRVMSMGTDGRARSFAFVDADAVGFDHPVRAVFSEEWQFPLLPKFLQRSRFRFPGSNRAPHFFGPFATVMKLETVIFYDVAGYQRNGVNEDFYHSFRPDDVTCMEHRVEAIYQATVPELREEFKRTFMDNWIDGRSFVLISY